VIEYLRHCEATGQTERFIEKKESYLARIGAWTRGGARVFQGLDSWDANDVRSFLAAIAEGEVGGRKVGPATYNRTLAALRGLMTWARKEKRTANYSDTEVDFIREERDSEARFEIPEKRWRLVLAQLPERWRLAGEVQLGAGLRYGEVAALAPGDVQANGIDVPRSKGGRGRTIPATARTVAAPRQLLDLGGIPDDEGSQFNHRLEVAARKARQEPFTTHLLRHTYATVCLRNGVGLRELQDRMGHASIKTTEKYLHALRATDGKRQAVGAPL
jgi:integrase/recombinase XerD